MKRRELIQFGTLLGTSLFAPTVMLRPSTARAAPTGFPSDAEIAKVPVTLIGLPYLMGTRAANSMFGMAQGPIVLLQPENLPNAFNSFFSDVEVIMLDNVDEPEGQELARGDQMARILGQNLALAKAVRQARAKGGTSVSSARLATVYPIEAPRKFGVEHRF